MSGQAVASAIQSRAKGADEKTPASAPGAAAQDLQALGARLWALASPIPLTGYEPPWDGISASIWARLLDALAAPAARRAATPAALLGYAACVKTLLRGAPAVHRAITDIRGLALAVVPDLVKGERAAAAPAPKVELPGEPLVYDDVAVY